MGKKKFKKSWTGKEVVRAKRLPRKDEQYAVAREALGGSRFSVLCDDGLTRKMRMPGKFKKRMWVRVNDLIIIKPWVVQSDKKCDLVYRFLPPERRWIYNNKRVKKHLVI